MFLRLASRARRAGVALVAPASVLAVVLTGAAWGPGPAVVEAASGRIRGLDPAAVFPDSTLALVQFDGRPCLKHAKDLGVSRIMRSPEMEAFAGGVMQMAEGGIQGGLASLDLPFDVAELADLLMTGRTMLGVTRVETAVVNKGDFQSKQTSVDLMFALNFAQGRQESMKKILDGAKKWIKDQSSGPPPKDDVTIGGQPATTFALQEGESFRPFSQLTYVIVDDWVLAGTNDSQLEQAVLRIKAGDAKGSLAVYPTYKKCAEQTLRPKSIIGLYLGLKDALARVEKLEHGPEIVKQLKGSGIEQMTAFALGSELDGLAMRDRIYIHGYNPTGLVAKPELDKVHAMLPKSSSMAMSTAFDLSKFLDLMLAAFASEMGDAPAKAIAKFENAHQIKVREDLLAAFGPEIGVYATLPRYGLVPDFGLLVRTPDVAKAKAAMQKLVSIGKLTPDLSTLDHRGVEVSYVEISGTKLKIEGEQMHLHPCFTFVDGYMLVSPWPQAAKNFLDALRRKDGGFAARDDVAAAFARLRADTPDAGMGGTYYFDLPSLVGFLLDVAVPAAQCAVSPAELSQQFGGMVELDFAKFPPTELFTSNLSPLLMTTQYDGEGMSSFVVSPVGFSTFYGAMVAGAVGYFVARGEMSAPGASEVLPPPKKAEPEPMKDDEDK
jgi:hypothetical protein